MFSANTTKDKSLEFQKYQVSNFAEIWECTETKEKSLHSLVKFMPGETITKFGFKVCLEKPNYLTVQINDTEHILLSPEFLQYINHSCNPNVFFDTTKMLITCLRKIEIGEAMTFFYPSTEWSMAQEFNCLCGTEKCLGKIQGAAHLSSDILQNYQLTEYIQKKIAK
ncbi:MAG: SET domain-containing protein-lysine N-methyltransferase [Oscillatoria sp. PMC 1068.18]|nr:SET domain-containing protein-lysine N-methyltransferase [Oscillatoria sp. PMC 1068.18]